ncbi:DUF885 domain-containing protein [Oleisolibacter albus]|uniref:DUF885 domain-containing protein n=1 Tax=Oleisolibacter albus TaxID=2171757 RepID=UPI000DF216C9|nr:DUF885 domain-containing protein [Oleisolibacter albus]
MSSCTRRTALSGLLAVSAAPLLPGWVRAAGAAPAQTAEDAKVLAFLEQAWQQALARSPEMRTQLGLPGPHDSWTVADEAFLAEGHRLAQDNLKRIRAFKAESLSRPVHVSARLFEVQMVEQVRAYGWRDHQYAVSQLEGPHTNIPSFLIGYHAVASAADARDYVTRLERAPLVLDAAVAHLQRAAAKGIMPPAFSYPRILVAARAVLTGVPFESAAKSDSPILADLKEKVAALEIPLADKGALIAAGNRALTEKLAPAYRHFIAAIEAMQTRQSRSDGAWALPDGAAYYKDRIFSVTSLELEPEAIHELGLKETQRLHGEMQAVMTVLGFTGTVRQFFDHIRTSPDLRFPDSEAGRKEYLATATAYIDEMKARLDEFFITKPKADIVVKPVEAFRENATPSAFYEQSSPDGKRPGVFYANLSDMSVQTRHDLQSLCFHEAIPGHHMQVAIAQEMEGLPTFRRFGFDVAYGEGWAMYSERMAKDFGFYKEPWSEAGRIASELFRAGRLVVDTGIHHKKWTREQAIAWMAENTANSLADNENEIERYFVWPGQALGYKIGMNKILDLRETARRELGPKFDLRGFHEVVLTNGSVILPVLEELVLAWIDDVKRGA